MAHRYFSSHHSDAGGIEFVHDKKLDALEDIIEAANGKSILAAYWYKHDLTRIIDRLEALGVNYGKLDSDQSIEDWNAGSQKVFITGVRTEPAD